VPVGTGRRLQRLFKAKRPDLEIDVASNPEFLREGSAIEDFLRPDRVVCGVESARAHEILSQAYRPLNLIETPIMFTTLETAELVKYATNSFLATKITFINEMADLCEKVGADVQQVAKGMGLDGRIGRKFLHAGPGYGGSCFPKDTLALLRTGEQYDSPLRIVEAVVNVNEHRKRRMVRKIVDAMGGQIAGKTIGVLGVTFKPNTDDMRDSPSLVILPALRAEGAKVRAFDPEGMAEAAKLLPEIDWCEGPYDPAIGADALVVLTEWNVFRGLDLERLKSEMHTPLLIDLRNIFDPERVAMAGFAYASIGRSTTPGIFAS
jgi:UDPglucose 6-dehydrogenase